VLAFRISSKAFSDRRVINLSSMTLIDRGNMILNKIKVNTLIANTNQTIDCDDFSETACHSTHKILFAT
jgi:hypothetical protein